MTDMLHTQITVNYDRIISGTVSGLLTTRGSTVDELSAVCGITRATLYRKLRLGKWTANEAGAVAGAFGVPVADLYAGHVTAGAALPRLDSNQKPSDLQFAEIEAYANAGWVS